MTERTDGPPNRQKYAALLVLIFCLAGCAPQETTGSGPNSSASVSDVTPVRTGSYYTREEVFLGDALLSGVHVNQAGPGAWNPDPSSLRPAGVMVIFKDTSSQVQSADPAGSVYTRYIAVSPTRYSIIGNKIEFEGTDPAVGYVAFVGVFDPNAMREVNAPNGDVDELVVLRGDIRVNSHVVRGIEFFWAND